MNTRSIVRIVAILAISCGPLFAAGKPEAEAQKAAEQWLALVDAGKYARSWETAAPLLQSAMPTEQWAKTLASVREPLGRVVSRKLKSATPTRSLPGAPDGEYVVLVFETSFANKQSATETVTPMLDKDGTWKVAGYYIR
jgi:hypothetical protein